MFEERIAPLMTGERQSTCNVMHGGHDEFATRDDPADQDFLAWIERFAACNP